jgi:hypothetical protein
MKNVSGLEVISLITIKGITETKHGVKLKWVELYKGEAIIHALVLSDVEPSNIELAEDAEKGVKVLVTHNGISEEYPLDGIDANETKSIALVFLDTELTHGFYETETFKSTEILTFDEPFTKAEYDLLVTLSVKLL